MQQTRLSYTLDAAELADAMILHLPSFRLNMRIIRVFWGVLAVCFLALALVAYRGMAGPFAMTLLAASTARFQVRRGALRLLRRGGGLTDPVRVTLDGDGLQIDSDLSRLWYAWRNYQAVVTSSAGLGLVGRGGTVLRWIPARAFSSDSELETWATIARNAIAGQ